MCLLNAICHRLRAMTNLLHIFAMASLAEKGHTRFSQPRLHKTCKTHRHNSVFRRVPECHSPGLDHLQDLILGLLVTRVLEQFPEFFHKCFRGDLIMNERSTVLHARFQNLKEIVKLVKNWFQLLWQHHVIPYRQTVIDDMRVLVVELFLDGADGILGGRVS